MTSMNFDFSASHDREKKKCALYKNTRMVDAKY